MFDKKKFMWITFGVLVLFNLSRFIGWRYFSETSLWKTVVYDNLHHYQLGLFLLVLAFFVKRLRTLILAIGAGMVLDEAMYLFYPLNNAFSHGTIIGFVFEFGIWGLMCSLLLWNGKVRAMGAKISS